MFDTICGIINSYNTTYSSYYLLIIITNFLDISLYRKRGRIKTKTNH